MTELNTINKIKNFADNRMKIGYQFEPPSGISPSVIIFGEKHTDQTERKDQEDLINNLGLANFVLLAEAKDYFKRWEGKYGCCKVALCDLKKRDKDKKQKELLNSHLTTQELENIKDYGCGIDTHFDHCVEKFPYLMQLFNNAREKAMGEIICREKSKPIVVIIGHNHAKKDSKVHKILEKEEVDHICIWNEKAVEEIKER